MTSSDKQHQLPQDERALEQLARASLDDSVAYLDASTLSRLNRARQKALAEANRNFFQRHWLSMGATACAALALAITLPLMQQGTPAGEAMPGIEEAYISASEDAELLEDLDLVLWLMELEDHAS
jgi:hypothetical protein